MTSISPEAGGSGQTPGSATAIQSPAERWHEELHGMNSGAALYEGQQEYVRLEDYEALRSALTAAQETNKRLNRRCQEAEAALPDYRKLLAVPPDGDGVRFVSGSLAVSRCRRVPVGGAHTKPRVCGHDHRVNEQ